MHDTDPKGSAMPIESYQRMRPEEKLRKCSKKV